VEITFADEDDVVSEQIPEPLASVSSRKLRESGSDESISAEMPVAEGYRFVHMESLLFPLASIRLLEGGI